MKVFPRLSLLLLMMASCKCCVSRCRRKSTFRWNARGHNSHANGLNPVCLRECVIKLEDWLNAFPQTAHLWGFSPVWIYVCFFMSDFWWNRFPIIENERSVLLSFFYIYFIISCNKICFIFDDFICCCIYIFMWQ